MTHSLFLDTNELDCLVEAIERVDPSCLPGLRWLVFGPYALSKIFPEGFCMEPALPDIKKLVAELEKSHSRHGQQIKTLLRSDRALENLDRLESYPPEHWSHPVQVLERPWELDRMRRLCQQLLSSGTTDASRRELLQSIDAKLAAAQVLEATAAERRRTDWQHPKSRVEC
jgi:hypothetical protein